MSKKELKDIKPIVDIFLDLDGTALANKLGLSIPIFNGADKPGELGPWTALEEFKDEYSDSVVVRNRVLTSRQRIESSGFKIAKTINFKPRLKSTGMEFESKTGEIYFGMHYPSYGRVYLILDNGEHDLITPCFYWNKTDTSFLAYILEDQKHIKKFVLKPTEVDQVNALIDDSFKSGLLDEKKHSVLLQTIFKFAPVNRLVTFSANGKQIEDTNLDESDIDPAYRFTFVPKAWIMDKVRQEAQGKVLISVLLDDCESHEKYFKEHIDVRIDCSTFQEYDFGSTELADEVKSAIEAVENEIYQSALSYEHYKENLEALAPILVENFNMEEALSQFTASKRSTLYDSYEEALFQHLSLMNDDFSRSSFSRMMLICDDFVLLSNEKQIKILDDEKRSFNPLDSLLEFANLSCWIAHDKYGDSRVFHGIITAKSIIDIRIFLQKKDRTEQQFAVLLENISNELNSPIINYFPHNLIIFLNFILKIQAIQSLELPGFNQAAKIMIEEFRKELELPAPGTLVVITTPSQIETNQNTVS